MGKASTSMEMEVKTVPTVSSLLRTQTGALFARGAGCFERRCFVISALARLGAKASVLVPVACFGPVDEKEKPFAFIHTYVC